MFYRVLKETPYWHKGAIVEKRKTNDKEQYGYVAISEHWEKVKHHNYLYEICSVVEDEVNKDFFEKVYKDDSALYKNSKEIKRMQL